MKIKDDMKLCSRCDTVKLKADFHNNKRNSDGLQSICKECVRESQRKSAQKKKEKQEKELQDRLLGKRNDEDMRRAISHIERLLITINSMCAITGSKEESLSSYLAAIEFLKSQK